MSWTAIGAFTVAIALGIVSTCSLYQPGPSQPGGPAAMREAQRDNDTDESGETAPFEFAAESRVELAGGATVGAWDCQSDRVQGSIAPAADADVVEALFDRLQRRMEAEELFPPASIAIPEDYAFATQVRVPIRSFDCGDPRMERDMFEALKAEQHPAIAYQLTAVDIIEPIDAEADQIDDEMDRAAPALRLMTRGDLLLAGVTRRIEMEVTVTRTAPGRWTLLGRKELKMTDFDITPPSAFFGLIRAHDTVEVTFNLVARRHEPR